MSKCPYCKNALMIGEIGEYRGYVCSKALHIKDDCTLYQNGIPRDTRAELPQPPTLEEIMTGIGIKVN